MKTTYIEVTNTSSRRRAYLARKRKVEKINRIIDRVCAISMIGGFILILGSAGASDNGNPIPWKFLISGLLMFIGGFLVLYSRDRLN